MTYNATDHTKFPGHKRCPAHGECNNCMPLDGVETCWPIHRPIRYYLTAWGQVDKGVEVRQAGRVRGAAWRGVAWRGGRFREMRMTLVVVERWRW